MCQLVIVTSDERPGIRVGTLSNKIIKVEKFWMPEYVVVFLFYEMRFDMARINLVIIGKTGTLLDYTYIMVYSFIFIIIKN